MRHYARLQQYPVLLAMTTFLLLFSACSSDKSGSPSPVGVEPLSGGGLVPSPSNVVSGSGAEVGTIDVQWDPVSSTPEIDKYIIAYSTSPIDAYDISGLPTVEVQHDSGISLYQKVIGPFTAGTDYYVRIVARNTSSQESAPSSETSSEATDQFDFAATLMDWQSASNPIVLTNQFDVDVVSEGLFSTYSTSTTSTVTGQVNLTGVPKLATTMIQIEDPASGYYPVHIPPVDFDYNWTSWQFPMIEQGSFVRDTGSGPQTWRKVEVFYAAANYMDYALVSQVLSGLDNLTHFGYPHYSWPNQSVKLFVPEFTNSNGVDVKQVLLDAMADWNTALGNSVFQLASSEASADVVVDYDLPVSGSNAGEVILYPNQPQAAKAIQGKSTPTHGTLSFRDALPQFRVEEVAIHELGHVLQLPHSKDSSEVMVLGGGPTELAPPEIWAAKVLYRLPDGVNSVWWRMAEL